MIGVVESPQFESHPSITFFPKAGRSERVGVWPKPPRKRWWSSTTVGIPHHFPHSVGNSTRCGYKDTRVLRCGKTTTGGFCHATYRIYLSGTSSKTKGGAGSKSLQDSKYPQPLSHTNLHLTPLRVPPQLIHTNRPRSAGGVVKSLTGACRGCETWESTPQFPIDGT